MLGVRITLAEWASVQDGTVRIVRDGEDCVCGSDGGTSRWDDYPTYCPTCDDTGTVPLAEFVQACAPCETCEGRRIASAPTKCVSCGCTKGAWLDDETWTCRRCGDAWPEETFDIGPCPDCRIELVGSCPQCDGQGWWVDADPDPRTGEPGEPYQVPCQRCHEEGDGDGTITIGHGRVVGEPEPTDDGKWALRVQVVD